MAWLPSARKNDRVASASLRKALIGKMEHPPRPDERQFPLFDQVSTRMLCVAVGPEEMKGQYRYEWNGVLIGIGLK